MQVFGERLDQNRIEPQNSQTDMASFSLTREQRHFSGKSTIFSTSNTEMYIHRKKVNVKILHKTNSRGLEIQYSRWLVLHMAYLDSNLDIPHGSLSTTRNDP